MTHRQRIAEAKRQLNIAEENLRVAEQNKELATRNVSELKSLLEELGGLEGRARKGKKKLLSDEDLINIDASLTK